MLTSDNRGLPPNHPTVIAQGYNPVLVETALRADFANILKAGYNARCMWSDGAP
jgi:hypothetical protein